MRKKILMQTTIFSSLLFLEVILPFSSSFAQEQFTKKSNVSSESQTKIIKSFLSEEKIPFQSQLTSPLDTGTFPENISVVIQADIDKSKEDLNKSGISNVIFLFSHNYFIGGKDFILKFINMTKEKKLPYNSIIVFTPESEKEMFPKESLSETPTEKFVEELLEEDSFCAILVRDEKFSPPCISTEGAGTISPEWIVKAAKNACLQNQKHIEIKKSLLYIYKPASYKNNRRLSSFLDSGIPALEISMGKSQKDLEVLLSIEDNITEKRSQEWNTNYNFIPIGLTGFWLNETELTFIYLLFASLTLFFICFYSFSNNQKNLDFFKDLSKTWFLILFYILLSSIALTLFQYIFLFQAKNGTLYFTLKIFISLWLVLFIVFLQAAYDIRISLSSSNFLSLVSGSLSILVFSAIDISLMFLFALEYFILFCFRRQKRIALTGLCIILLIPSLSRISASILADVDQEKIITLIKAPFFENIILSLVFLPFIFQFSKLSLIYGVKRFKGEKKRVFKAGIIFSFSSTVIIATVFFASSLIIQRNFFLPENRMYSKA